MKNHPMALQYQEGVNPIKPDVHKMDKHTLKNLAENAARFTTCV